MVTDTSLNCHQIDDDMIVIYWMTCYNRLPMRCTDQIKHTIPEPKDQRANRTRRGSKGGRPTGFDSKIHKRRNEVKRTINRLRNSRAVATRYDKRAYVFQGTVTVTVAAIRLWL
ncbi:hypothetical protein SLAV_37960 [Streptomyces lavendulae subsp. lavendulae]|uniref:Uncharacterized protein n=1 Tax=Streptomyces lavendulae subsp. lavendulae TaxID=58340 RepID=A0A2K8PRH3_STRLA|nr:hypothetical protein SLAV_37960 [Streptomyces lavendulae subsp. lavendulae]QUQ59166.1 hypothetical protein SLLC_36100 [Streptomyces lavendulae subsp. lavendulae]